MKCIICGQYTDKTYCNRHRRSYLIDKKFTVSRLKPKIKVSNPQTLIYRCLRELYGEEIFQEVTFTWMPYRRFDIVLMNQKVIVEYDGEQHFKFIKLWHKTKEGFLDYLQQAKDKETVAKMHGYKVVRFSYKEDIEDKEYIKNKMKLKGGI